MTKVPSVFSKSLRPRLITFDAFDTLVAPQRSVAYQYSKYIENVSGVHVSEQDVKKKFATAFARMSQQHPNYGRATNLDVERWWHMIISDVFAGYNLPSHAFSGLYSHFTSSTPYYVYGDAMELLKKLTSMPSTSTSTSPASASASSGRSHHQHEPVHCAVLSNSDPRIRNILYDLIFALLPENAATKNASPPVFNEYQKIPCFISYETGYEKPSPEAFAVVEDYAQAQLGIPASSESESLWHVGDHVHKDYNGAMTAGWNAVLIDRTGKHSAERQAIVDQCTSLYQDPTLTVGLYNGRARVYVQDMTRLLDVWDFS